MGRPSLAARLQARLSASRLDREVEAGAMVVPELRWPHVARLTSVKQRQALARGLRRAVDATDSPWRGVRARSRFTRVELRQTARRSIRSLRCWSRPARSTRAGWPGLRMLAHRRHRTAI